MSFGMQYGNKYSDKRGEHTNSINGERYVFYQRLNTDRSDNKEVQQSWRELYRKADSLMRYRIDAGTNAAAIADYFLNLRDAEYAKECALLESKLGKNFLKGYSYRGDEDDANEIGTMLVKGFNQLLNFKGVFMRNFELITKTRGQKQLITFFDYYFDKKFQEHKETIINEIKMEIEGNLDIEAAAQKVFNAHVPEIVREALIYMFTEAKPESGLPDIKEFEDAYKDLAKYLKKGNAIGDQLVQNLIQSYGLNDIMSQFDGLTSKNLKKKIKSANFQLGMKARMSKGGSASEDLGTFVAQVAIDGLQNASAHKTGETKQKADFIISFDLPTGAIEEWLDNNVFGTRDLNTKALTDLYNRVSALDEGFIVLTNAKNYTLNEGFDKRYGFSAGEKISMDTWDTMMHNVHHRGRDLIFMALQTIPGAVGQGYKKEVSTTFARAIGSALFDDFDTIGQVHTGTNFIHLLYLNGIYLPLSFYYNLLYQAFNEYSKKEISKLVQVTISTPEKIMFPKMKDQRAWQETHEGESAWNAQSHAALDATTVEYHFFAAFQKEMKKLNVDLF